MKLHTLLMIGLVVSACEAVRNNEKDNHSGPAHLPVMPPISNSNAVKPDPLKFVTLASGDEVKAKSERRDDQLLTDPRTPARRDVRKRRAAKDDVFAYKIFIAASQALEFIDNFKEEYTQSFLFMSWDEADKFVSQRYINALYLPSVPYSPLHLDYELKRAYTLMQHCVVSLEDLNLDHVYKDDGKFFSQVNELIISVTQSLDYLKLYMESEQCSPNNEETQALTKMIYEHVEISDQLIRDFAILRDVRETFVNIRDTFKEFLFV